MQKLTYTVNVSNTHSSLQPVLCPSVRLCKNAVWYAPLNSHTAHNMPLLPVAVNKRIFIHKIHIHYIIRKLFIKLLIVFYLFRRPEPLHQ